MEASGLKYDAEKVPLELLDPLALEGLGKVLEFGRKKYSQRGECDCHVVIVNEILKYGPKDFANLVTTLKANRTTTNVIYLITENTDKITKSDLLNGNVSIWLKILTKKNLSAALLLDDSTELTMLNWIASLHNLLVQSVEGQINYVSITATQQGKLENDFAKAVISLLDFSKEQSGWTKHNNICSSIKEIKTGAHNWRGGIGYSRLLGAALRHTFAIVRGEDTDPESGLPHVDHLGCCWMFLSNMMKTRTDLDDRWKTNG